MSTSSLKLMAPILPALAFTVPTALRAVLLSAELVTLIEEPGLEISFLDFSFMMLFGMRLPSARAALTPTLERAPLIVD